MKISFAFILAALLSLNSMAVSFTAQGTANKEPKSQALHIDTLKQQSIEQIMGLAPGMQVKKCEVVIESGGTVYKFNYGEFSKADSERRIWERLKKTRPKDILFIDNVYVIKDGKLMKLTGQKAYTIQ